VPLWIGTCAGFESLVFVVLPYRNDSATLHPACLCVPAGDARREQDVRMSSPHSLDLDLLSLTPIGSAGHASPRSWGCPADSADFRFVIKHRACRACRRDRCYVGAWPVALGCGRQSRTERSGGRVCRFPSNDLRRLVKSATCHGLRSPRAQGAGRSFFGWCDWLWHSADRTCDRSARGAVADGVALDFGFDLAVCRSACGGHSA